MIVWYRVDKTQEDVNEYINALDKLVMENAKLALNLNSLDTTNRKQNLWYEKAMEYLKLNKKTFKEMNLLYASYGYAVEELTNLRIRELINVAPNVIILTQVTSGSTRPDIVISKNFEQIAWFDITSENSIGHIDYKASSKWNTMPTVVEIAYPTLDLSQIRFSEDDFIANKAKAINARRVHEAYKRNLVNCMVEKIDHILALPKFTKKAPPTPLTKADVAMAFSEEMCFIPANRKHKIIYSMLLIYLNNNGLYKQVAKYILLQIYGTHHNRDLSAAYDVLNLNFEKNLNKEQFFEFYDDNSDFDMF